MKSYFGFASEENSLNLVLLSVWDLSIVMYSLQIRTFQKLDVSFLR
jgi:hypothetical protein